MNRNNCELGQTTSKLGCPKLGCSINIKDPKQVTRALKWRQVPELVVNPEAFLFTYLEPHHKTTWGAGAVWL